MRGKSYFCKVCIIAGFLLMPSLTGSMPLYAQQQLLPCSDCITIAAGNRSLSDVMAEIAKQSHLNFHYDKAAIDLNKKITLHCKDLPVREVLDKLSIRTGLSFLIKQDKIIVSATAMETTGGNTEATDGDNLWQITGRVLDTQGRPIPGATILVKGTHNGVHTDDEGYYAILVTPADILIFRSVGFLNREICSGDQHSLDVMLTESVFGLNEQVVTALGIPKSNKELPYSTGHLVSDDISTVKDANVINSLSGKIAGVMINRSASGIGGSARVILRGNKSTRENQPLYIIDGVPMANFTPSQPTDIWGQSSGIVGTGGRDGGDGISNINPDDIESISVLKSASSAALYGSQAANGVIMITTKKGNAGKGRINVASDLMVDAPMLLPKLQFRYGQTTRPYKDDKDKLQPGSADSWGDKVQAPDHTRDFFRTGLTSTNGLSYSGGAENTQYYLSYANTMNRGILPANHFQRHTFNTRITSNLLKKKLAVDANISYVIQDVLNRPSSGLYYNALTGLYNMPRGLDFNTYKQYEYHDPTSNLSLQNWWNIRRDRDWTGLDDQQNPYWVQYRDQRRETRYRGMASLSLKYRLASWLWLQARGNIDKSDDRYEMSAHAGTQQVLSPPNGRYTREVENNTQLYADMILTGSKQFCPQVKVQAMLGVSITDVKAHDRTLTSTNPTAADGLIVPNVFSTDNISAKALDAQKSIDKKQLQALFGSAQLNWKQRVFLDLTGRNDWSSTFAFTPIKDKGYFYYSAGISTVLSEWFNLPAAISFAKVRVSYAKAGSDIAPYASRPARFLIMTTAGVPRVNFNTRAPYPGIYLKPEDNRSLETGLEFRFLKDRVGIDVTWYKNNNYQQYMEVRAPTGSGYLFYYLNLGNIQNKGWEATLNIVPVQERQWRWNTNFNLTINSNKVVKLSNNSIPGAGPDNYYILTDFLTNMYGSFIKEGGSWGDIYTNKELYRNDKGQLVIDNQGNLITRNVLKKVGNPNPRFMLGWNNSITYKNYALSFQIDGRFGGKVMSVTNSVLDSYGVSEASAKARDAGGVTINAVYENGAPLTGTYDERKYFATIGGRAGIGETYMYDATNIRLREISLTCKLPLKSKWINMMQVGLIGRNLCFFKLNAPFDPEVSMSSGNGLQGIDVFGVSALRSIGANIKLVL
ncbi:SusC/RagA family TonB-linked outer membrane protein [Chitinophaga ginsengisoli]|uniref:TonB-linked SusC/RagA family outer membrane protein n=1 Tax=Chitinophaga ginsengisoli TaxID=363837 RepID=A0A2P8G7B4_9BACT|nr:SusC/RagA family TonB-linked outer membrane protein [Chitinophaga ginsengisoli]PSL29868.1 TonB-linked SusC/RagA family outer membrane protein [Chitinophaga ginsengisoli]